MKLFLGLAMISIATSANAASVTDKDFLRIIAKYEAIENTKHKTVTKYEASQNTRYKANVNPVNVVKYKPDITPVNFTSQNARYEAMQNAQAAVNAANEARAEMAKFKLRRNRKRVLNAFN